MENTMPQTGIRNVIDRLVRRVRLVRALGYLVRSALAAAMILCLGLISDKFAPVSAQAWLVLFTLASMVAFALVRLPHSAFSEAWMLYWPVLLAGVAGLMLPVAALAGRSAKWRPFREPTYLTGVVVAPLSACVHATPAGS